MSCLNSSDRRWGRKETVTFRFRLHKVANGRGRCCFDWENFISWTEMCGFLSREGHVYTSKMKTLQ